MDKLSIITLVKNEELYLEQFIDYYKRNKVSKIYIYDDESTDNTKELLQKYIDEGFVVYNYIVRRDKNNPSKFLDRWAHYNHFNNNYSKKTDWLLCIDIDEFLTFTKHLNKTNIGFLDIINLYESKNIRGVCFDMINFLPIDNEDKNIPSILQYEKCIKKNIIFNLKKCLVKVKYIEFDKISNNHFIPIGKNNYYSSNFEKLISKKIILKSPNLIIFNLFKIPDNQILEINHYKFRNFENKIENYKFNTWNNFYKKETFNKMLNFNNFNYNTLLKKFYIKNIDNKNNFYFTLSD